MIPGLDVIGPSLPPLGEAKATGMIIRGRQTNPVWRMMVQRPSSNDSALPMAVKWMGAQHKLALELACSLAGAEFNLPIPHGALVLAERSDLPGLSESARPLAGMDRYLCFGGVLQFPHDLIARLTDDEPVEEFIWRDFCAAVTAAPAAAWDELSANADRHTENLIFDGSKYWLIDHEQALGSLASVMCRFAEAVVRRSVVEHRANTNEIASQLVRRRPGDHGLQFQPRLFERAVPKLAALIHNVQRWRTGMSSVDEVWELTAIILKGIEIRLPALALMIEQRLNNPLGRTPWSDPTSPNLI